MNRLIPLVKKIKFFREFIVEKDNGGSKTTNTETEKNLREIVSCLTYEFLPNGCNVFEYGKSHSTKYNVDLYRQLR